MEKMSDAPIQRASAQVASKAISDVFDNNRPRREGSLSLNTKKQQQEEEKEEEKKSEKRQSSRFPKRPPWIDPVYAQAQVSIGPFDRTKRPPSPPHPETRVIWTGEITSEVISYLNFCRRLLGTNIPPTEPLEQDENALQFLMEHAGNDVEKAKLLIVSSMGAGSEKELLEQQNSQIKTRPRTKSLIMASRAMGGEKEDVADETNPAKIRNLWKDWISRAKRACTSSSCQAISLLQLQREGVNIPKLIAKGPEDDSLTTQAMECLVDLENKLRELDDISAAIHDALSLVRSDRKLSVGELKKLVQEVPNKVLSKEAEILKGILAKSEEWERDCNRWLDDTAYTTITTQQLQQQQQQQQQQHQQLVPDETEESSSKRRKSSSRYTQTNVSQEFTLASLSELIREGKNSPVDHSVALAALERKKVQCEHIMEQLILHVPQDKTWRSNKKLFEILPLAELKAIATQIRKLKLKVPEGQFLDAHVSAAEEWLAQVRSAMSTKCTIKELQGFIHKAEQIPVDLGEEKKKIEKFLDRANEWVKSAKAFFGPIGGVARSGGFTFSLPKKTRSSDDVSTEKADATELISLRDEAQQLGIEVLTETQSTFEAAETVEEWSQRVKEVLKNTTNEQLDLVNSLLREAEDLPVVVPEEKILRAEAAGRNWSRRASELLKAETGTVPYTEFEALLIEADALANPLENERGGNGSGGGGGSSKKKKNTNATTNTKQRNALFECEEEIKAILDEANKWKSKVEVINLNLEKTEKLSFEQAKEYFQITLPCTMKEYQMKLKKRLLDLTKWQMKIRNVLISGGRNALKDFENIPLISDLVPFLSSLTPEEKLVASDVIPSTPVEEEGQSNNNSPATQEESPFTPREKIRLDELKEFLAEGSRIGIRTTEYEWLIESEKTYRAWILRLAVAVLDPNSSAVKKKKRRLDDIPSAGRLAMQESDLLAMKEEAKSIVVDVSSRLADIDNCLAITNEWKRLCREPLDKYRQLIMDRDKQCKEEDLAIFQRPNRTLVKPDSASVSLADRLGVTVLDANQVPVFPGETEKDCSWWIEPVSSEVEQAIEAICEAMREAERKKLHFVAMDCPEVRSCAWIIRTKLWLDEMNEDVLGMNKPLLVLCQYVLLGVRLGRRDDDMFSIRDEPDLPNKFPDSELESTNGMMMIPLADKPITGPPSKRAKKVEEVAVVVMDADEDLDATNHEEEVATTTTSINTTTKAASNSSQLNRKEWSLLKYIGDKVTAREVDLVEPSTSNYGLGGLLTRRLFGLQRICQAAIAWQGKARSLHSVPRVEKTTELLESLIHIPVNWSVHVSLVVPEENRVKQDLEHAQNWLKEVQGTLDNSNYSIEYLEKLANRGDRLFVSVKKVQHLRNVCKQGKEWLERFHSTGLDKGKSTLEELRTLLREGESIWGIDLSEQLEVLRNATEVFCMCRGGRDENMFSCIDCKEVFHYNCINNTSVGEICAVCLANRALGRCIGVGYTALARVLALELTQDLLAFPPEDTDKRRLLIEWTNALKEFLKGNLIETATPEELTAHFPKPAEILLECFEVKSAVDIVYARRWKVLLEKQRHRPSLTELEHCVTSVPNGISADALVLLIGIQNRGKEVVQLVNSIWALPEATPSTIAVQRCREALELFDNLPIDLSPFQRAVEACINDNATRHCVCRRFDDGTMMVNCGNCDKWFHQGCLPANSVVDDFICPKCQIRLAAQKAAESATPSASPPVESNTPNLEVTPSSSNGTNHQPHAPKEEQPETVEKDIDPLPAEQSSDTKGDLIENGDVKMVVDHGY